jgi:hypothetical protein
LVGCWLGRPCRGDSRGGGGGGGTEGAAPKALLTKAPILGRRARCTPKAMRGEAGTPSRKDPPPNLYTGRMMSSGTAGPRDFMRSYRVWAALLVFWGVAFLGGRREVGGGVSGVDAGVFLIGVGFVGFVGCVCVGGVGRRHWSNRRSNPRSKPGQPPHLSISSWPVRNSRMSPSGSDRWIWEV